MLTQGSSSIHTRTETSACLSWPSGSSSYTFVSWIWLISYLLGSGGFYNAGTLNRVSTKTVRGKCHCFPRSHTCLLATQLQVPPGAIHWSISPMSHSASVPNPAARAHWLSRLLLHRQSIRDPSSLYISCFSTTAIYPMPKKHWEMYLCALQKALSLFIQLSPCVKMRNWIIHCTSQTWMTKLEFAALSSREEGEWSWGGRSLRERGRTVSLCSTAGSIVDAIINHL